MPIAVILFFVALVVFPVVILFIFDKLQRRANERHAAETARLEEELRRR